MVITKLKNVYYCEFCNKHGLSAGAMTKHEKHCTANPDRVCRLCGETNIRAIIDGLKPKIEAIVKKYNAVYPCPELPDFEQECPNCTLTVLRCTKLNIPYYDIKYDYKEKLAEWWANFNEEERKAEYQGMLAEGMDL